jgi:two-component system NarL family response regulator
MGRGQPAKDSGIPATGDKMRIRVLVADDHPLIRAGLQSSLANEPDMFVVGEATNGEEVQRLCLKSKPDVLLLDLRMPGPSALETIAYLRQHHPQTRVLMLTAYDDEAHVRWLVEAGVAGYLLKEEAPATVVQAIRAVMGGGSWFSQQVAEKLARPTESPALTQREREVLRLIAQGKSNQQIAEELSIAETTVRFHLRNLYSKVGVTSRAEAIVWTLQGGSGKDLS